MPINDIHGKALGRTKKLMPQVFAGGGNDAGSADEDRRRRAVQSVAPAVVTPSGGGGGGTTPTPPPVPPAQVVIDRLHKESGGVYGGYVFVGHDHDVSEKDQMPPVNPGYKSVTATASTITDAYGKALAIALLTKADARVAVIVLGGKWYESVTLASPLIDVIGMGCPTIAGVVTIAPTCSKIRFAGFTIDAQDTNTPLYVMPGPMVQNPPPFFDRLSTVRLENLFVRGATTAFEFYKQVYVKDSVFAQTTNVDFSYGLATVIGHGSGDDQDWSVFRNCEIKAYTSLISPVAGLVSPEPQGYAFKATTRSPAGTYLATQAFLTGQTPAYYILPNSGVRLIDCDIQGSLLNEGWTVQHVGGTQCAGLPLLTARGGIYCRQRGYVLFGSDGFRYGQLPARTLFENCTTTAAMIGDFVPDPLQTTPNTWGGHVNFRNSLHLSRFNSGGAPTAFSAGVTVAEADVINSATSCPGWGGMAVTYGTCPVSVPLFAMYDPYNL